ncbi:MAG: tyrosine-type recombinase/integrase [bacterium]
MPAQPPYPPPNPADFGRSASNVKPSFKRRQYARFGQTIRYMTVEELQGFFDAIEDYRHKLMMRMLYELGCRVGEFVRIQLRHLCFRRATVRFPAANTKTRTARVSHLPAGLVNEIKSLLRREGRMAKRSERIYRPDEYLFHPATRADRPYSANRLRQVFRSYVRRAGLDSEYGEDRRGRRLHALTIHSLRHSHIMHYVHVHRLPLPVVQRQVGHKSLKTTSIYLRPSDEHVGQAYADVRRHAAENVPKGLNTSDVLSFENDSTYPTPR